MITILILSPHLDQSIALARFIYKYGVNIEVHGGVIRGEKSKKTPLFRKMVNIGGPNIIKEYDIVIPTGAQSTQWLLNVKGEFTVNGLVYNQNNLICFDKIRMLNKVEEMGIPIPKTMTSIESIHHQYPVFYKHKYEKGKGSRGVAYSDTDLTQLPDLKDLIFQEWIQGRSTFGVGYLAQKGELLTFSMHEEFLSFPIQGGSAVCIRSINYPTLLDYTKQIIKILNLSGWGLTEFKYCPKRNLFVFMELNAKMWASIEFAFLNNNQFLKYLLDLDYSNQNVYSAVFLDRLLRLGMNETLHQLKNLCHGKVISYQDYIGIIKLIVLPIFPKFINNAARKMLNQCKQVPNNKMTSPR